MPKKTKKQKILAKLHRQKQLLKQNNLISQPSPLPVSPKKENVNKDYQKALNTQDDVLKKYFLIDFRKSLIIVVLIIALEIAFYFAKLIK
ncbi:MAG: hypothetical protein ACPLRN_03205 [Microgenomates group bacterium]